MCSTPSSGNKDIGTIMTRFPYLHTNLSYTTSKIILKSPGIKKKLKSCIISDEWVKRRRKGEARGDGRALLSKEAISNTLNTKAAEWFGNAVPLQSCRYSRGRETENHKIKTLQRFPPAFSAVQSLSSDEPSP